MTTKTPRKLTTAVSILSAAFWLLLPNGLTAQDPKPDTARKATDVGVVVIRANKPLHVIGHLPDVQESVIYAGKKTEVLVMDSLRANLAQDIERQILGRVPGAHFSETEGAGFPSNGVGFRGLDPTQSVEINTRQNGIGIAADLYGYPETYYTPPSEALSRIEVVRGSASLAFGPQFGGSVNYVVRDGSNLRRPTVFSAQTAGSDGLFNSFNSVGGVTERWKYYGFVHVRDDDGWRPNNEARQTAIYGSTTYSATDRLRFGIEYTAFRNRIHMHGGLSDEQFVPREVESETFRSGSLETRVRVDHGLFGRPNTLATGVRLFRGTLERFEGGPGSTASDFDMKLYGGTWERALTFGTTNAAAFAENLFRVTDRFSITPGVRYEFVRSTSRGYTDVDSVFTPRSYSYPLMGIGAQYAASGSTQIYANISGAYRPILYASLVPLGSIVRVDPNLRAARGYNADLGWRGIVSDVIKFDLSGFYLSYRDRIGTRTATDATGSFSESANIGNSVHTGAEAYIELDPFARAGDSAKTAFDIFTSLAYIDARYVSGQFKGNRVEQAPRILARVGLTYGLGPVSSTLQASHTSSSFGDANNSMRPVDDAVGGFVPSYTLLDWSGAANLGRRMELTFGVNNLANTRYFTKRTGEYPGPGILPGAGRRVYVGIDRAF